MKKFLSAFIAFGISYGVCAFATSSNSSRALKSELKKDPNVLKKMEIKSNDEAKSPEISGTVLNENESAPKNEESVNGVWDLMSEIKNRKKVEDYVQNSMVKILRESKLYKETIEYVENFAKLFMKLYESGENEEQWEKIDVSDFMKKMDVSVAKKGLYILFIVPENVYKLTYKLWEQDTRKIPEVYKMRNLMGDDWGKHFPGVYSQEGTEKARRLSDFFIKKLKLI